MTQQIIKPDFAILQNVLEWKINEYKFFYKEHFMKLSARKRIEAIESLSSLQLRYSKKEPGSLLIQEPELMRLNVEAASTIKSLFGESILSLFKKQDLPVDHKKNLPDKMPDNLLLGLLIAFGSAIEGFNEKTKQEWNYRKNFIAFMVDCLSAYGLHPYILLRDQSDKRFNLTLTHKHNVRNAIIETRLLLTADQFNEQFTIPYTNQRPIRWVTKFIPFAKIHEVRITTSLLKDDELELFANKHGFSWSAHEKDVEAFTDYCQDETEKYHPNPFEIVLAQNPPDNYLMADTALALKDCPKARKLFEKSVAAYYAGKRERTVLDEMRLAIELLLKHKLNNNKPLEKQLPDLGKLQKANSGSPELTNMFSKILDGYTLYQNTYVKHDDTVPDHEIGLMIELSSSFLKHICILKKQ